MAVVRQAGGTTLLSDHVPPDTTIIQIAYADRCFFKPVDSPGFGACARLQEDAKISSIPCPAERERESARFLVNI